MFRTVTADVLSPKYLILCDHPHCATFSVAPVPENIASEEEAQIQFVGALIQNGWTVRLDGHFCAAHRPPEKERRLVQAAHIVGVGSRPV